MRMYINIYECNQTTRLTAKHSRQKITPTIFSQTAPIQKKTDTVFNFEHIVLVGLVFQPAARCFVIELSLPSNRPDVRSERRDRPDVDITAIRIRIIKYNSRKHLFYKNVQLNWKSDYPS